MHTGLSNTVPPTQHEQRLTFLKERIAYYGAAGLYKIADAYAIALERAEAEQPKIIIPIVRA